MSFWNILRSVVRFFFLFVRPSPLVVNNDGAPGGGGGRESHREKVQENMWEKILKNDGGGGSCGLLLRLWGAATAAPF